MLVEKPSKGDICSLKLVTGEEIVTKVVEEKDGNFWVEKPCTVMPSQQGVGLVQSLFTADPNKPIAIRKDHVVMLVPSAEQIRIHYIKTTTGLEIVK